MMLAGVEGHFLEMVVQRVTYKLCERNDARIPYDKDSEEWMFGYGNRIKLLMSNIWSAGYKLHCPIQGYK